MRKEAAGARFQRCEGRQVLLSKLGAEGGQILQHPLLSHRLRERNDAALNQPSKQDLSHSVAVMLGNGH
jgi:hypothetical protein